MENPLANMDDSDEKKLYEIADHEDGGFKNLKQGSYVINSSTAPTSCWTKAGPIATFLLIVLAVLILIMQAVTVHQILTNPESADSAGATDALRTTDSPSTVCKCNFTIDPLILSHLQKSLDDSGAATDMVLNQILNITEVLGNSYESTQSIVDGLVNIVTTLGNLETNSITTEVLVNDVLAKVQNILYIQNTTEPITDPTSCQEIKMKDPDSPSGFYHIHSQIVYCNMDELCGSSDGWARIGFLNMDDATTDCPSNLKYHKAGNRRACGRPDGTTQGSCESQIFHSNGIQYSKICGRVTGYQYGSTDSISPWVSDINKPYVDGVSITRGESREHVWTFISGGSKKSASCPYCSSSAKKTQAFVGNDFFCEAGNPNYGWSLIFYQQRLWDGLQCGSAETACCNAPGIPWFNQTMNGTTTDYVELRVCGNQGIHDEDTLVGKYEIYIQ